MDKTMKTCMIVEDGYSRLYGRYWIKLPLIHQLSGMEPVFHMNLSASCYILVASITSSAMYH